MANNDLNKRLLADSDTDIGQLHKAGLKNKGKKDFQNIKNVSA